MVRLLAIALALVTLSAFAADSQKLTEESFRKNMGFAPTMRMAYRNLDCAPVSFDAFAQQMTQEGARADVDRSVDGGSITLTVRQRGSAACPAPYPPITEMPAFDLHDLAGKRVTNVSLKGRPTLVNFYFAKCKPCILEVGPLNEFAAARPNMNFLAVTFDGTAEAREFVEKYKFKWRVVPNARDLIDRVRVKSYPMMALFDANGRLLGTRRGGAKDALEAANVGPQLTLWTESLLRNAKK
jgi:thiol-disulfide isomerase/thioredoxin